MAQQHIILGTPPSGVDGDTDRGAWTKAEANFNELYGFVGTGDGSLTQQVTENTNDIAALQPAVAQNTQDVATLKPAVTQNTNNIAANTASINTLNSQMGQVNPMGGFKNKIINGAFDWNQRCITRAASTGSGYACDRWLENGMGTTTLAMQIFGLAPGESDAFYNVWNAHHVAIVSGNAATSAALTYQPIENVYTLSGQWVTVSFTARADTAGKKIGVELQQWFGASGSASVSNPLGAVTLTTAWARYSLTIQLPSIAGKTITPGTGALYLSFWYDAGANYAARASNIGSQSGSFDIAAVQVEQGKNATPFETRPFAIELALCQRYYEKSYDIGLAPGTPNGSGYVQASFSGLNSAQNSYQFYCPWKVTKRAIPTVTTYGYASGAAGKLQANGVDVASSQASFVNHCHIAGAAASAVPNINFVVHYTADAEI